MKKNKLQQYLPITDLEAEIINKQLEFGRYLLLFFIAIAIIIGCLTMIQLIPQILPINFDFGEILKIGCPIIASIFISYMYFI